MTKKAIFKKILKVTVIIFESYKNGEEFKMRD
jgi:hypothetical protein